MGGFVVFGDNAALEDLEAFGDLQVIEAFGTFGDNGALSGLRHLEIWR